MSKEELNVFSEEVLHVCEQERWHTVSLQKFINEIHQRAAIDRFLRSLPLNKPAFSIISDLAFTEANKALERLPYLRKKGKITGVLEPRNGKKPTSNEHMKKLFDSGEFQREESKNLAQLHSTT